MANGKIPQALQYFTEYLKQENARLEQEEKEQNINKAISQTATKFMELGPDATQEDARRLMFESVRKAVETDAPETIPFVQSLYQDSANYVEKNRINRQQSAIRDYVSRKYGIDAGTDLTGEQLASLIELDAQMITPYNFTEEEDGIQTSYMAQLTFQGGRYVPVPDSRIKLGSTDLNRAFRQELAIRNAGQGMTKLQAPAVQGVTDDGKSFLAEFHPGMGYVRSEYDSQGNPTGRKIPLTETEMASLTSRTHPSVVRARDLREAVAVSKTAFVQANASAQGLAQYLVNLTDIPKELKAALRNIESGELSGSNLELLKTYINTPTPEGNQLVALIEELDETQKDIAYTFYNQLVPRLFALDQANQQITDFTGIEPTDNLSAPEVGEYVSEISRLFDTPNANPRAVENVKKAIATVMLKYDQPYNPEYNTRTYWNQLSPKLKREAITLIKKYAGQQNAK